MSDSDSNGVAKRDEVVQPSDPFSPVVGFEKPFLFHIRVAPSLNTVSVFGAYTHPGPFHLRVPRRLFFRGSKEKDVPHNDPICKSDYLI